MDDDLTTRLRAIEGPVQPRDAFVGELHDELAARLGFVSAPSVAVGTAARRSNRPRWVWLVAAALLLTLLFANLAAIGSLVERTIQGPTVMDTIRSTGFVRLAVRPDDAQVVGSNGALQGFDIDVAEAVARRLGARPELVVLAADEMLTQDRGSWQIALPGFSPPASAVGGDLLTSPYYHWPIYVVSKVDVVGTVPDLVGGTVCVVAGSIGEAWLDPTIEDGVLTVRQPAPAAITIRSMADDDACLRDILDGGSTAMVTDRLLIPDLATIAGVQLVGTGAVASEPRVMVIPTDKRGALAFQHAVEAALAEMRADGTLAQMSRRRFGAEDLTTSVP
jgi:ABC-type amino acid transport substrate-binding protein